MKFSFKNDRFKKNRGGYSRLLSLHCEKCRHPFAHYQKDGPGILKRLYVDRLTFPGHRAGKEKNLICGKCKTILGVLTVYQKEKRPAYRLFAGAVGKRIVKSEKIKELKYRELG